MMTLLQGTLVVAGACALLTFAGLLWFLIADQKSGVAASVIVFSTLLATLTVMLVIVIVGELTGILVLLGAMLLGVTLGCIERHKMRREGRR